VPPQVGPGVGVQDRPTAQGQDAVVRRQRLGHRCTLEGPEVLFAVVDENFGDRPARGRFDVVVGVTDALAPALGEEPGDGRLAGAHRADQHHAWPHLNLIEPR
jgi:hypothetical protein